MTSSSGVDDYRWLTGDEAADLLRDLAAQPQALHSAAARLRRQLSAARTHLLLEQVELRCRAAAKFRLADRMFFTRIGLEQATDQWVAKHKAARFAGRGAVADLCCGLGGDLLALGETAEHLIGVDRDPIAALLAAANARAVLPPDLADRVNLSCVEVQRFAACGLAAWHIDPDRRPTGTRTTSLNGSSPDPQAIEQLLAAVPSAAVKLAPAANVPTAWEERCELEWIGRDRQCRQLVAWHGDLAGAPGWRRATVLTDSESDWSQSRSVVGEPDLPVPVADRLERYVLEPDPAVLAAHLAGALAAEFGLTALASGPAYLTGPGPIVDPILACFEVQEVLPLKMRLLAQHLRERAIGRLEIKTRGVDLDPEQVRRELKLRGDRAATLMLTVLSRKRVAMIVRRVTVARSPEFPSPEPRTLNPLHATRV